MERRESRFTQGLIADFKWAFKKRIKGSTDLEEWLWQKLEQFTISMNPTKSLRKVSINLFPMQDSNE